MTPDPPSDWITNGPPATGGFDEVRAPVRVGRYTLQELIGRGGMGVVYEAMQDEPSRRVAVKLMRNAVLTAEQVRRFKRESELLGQLHHPNIAEVIEAGTHVEGRIEVPYYAMQLIDRALPITRYAIERSLTRRERVALIVPVCRAVQHAHDNAVVHRDIKPSNVLVDGEGVARLIDLGLSRLMSDASRPMTASEYLVGTLQYMSPEQLLGAPSNPTTRWDVYSLGVVLYELLLGELPYRLVECNPFAVANAITQMPPTPPRSIDKAMPRDLETVILKAIHKDAAQRYQSAGELADDLQRWLDDRAVKARGDSIAYRFRVAARRSVGSHPVIASTLVGISVFLAAQPMKDGLAQVGVNDWWASTLTRWPGHAPDRPFQYVVMVTIDSDAPDIAKRARITSFDSSAPGGWRPLHGAAFDRLSQAGATVVAADIYFPQPSRFDAELVSGVTAAATRGTAIVVGRATWSAEDASLGVPALADVAGVGALLGVCGPERPWSVAVARLGPTGDAEAAMMTQAIAAWKKLPRSARFQVSEDGFIYAIRPGGSLERVLPFSEVAQPASSELDRPTRAADEVFRIWTEVPSDMSLRASTLRLSEVFDLPHSDLRSRVQGKLILYGDARPKGDRLVQTTDGRTLPGFVSHAAAIEAVLSDAVIGPSLRRFSFLGLRFSVEPLTWIFAIFVANLVAWRSTGARAAACWIAIALGVFVTVTVVLFKWTGLVFVPAAASLVTVLTAAAALCCKSLRLARN